MRNKTQNFGSLRTGINLIRASLGLSIIATIGLIFSLVLALTPLSFLGAGVGLTVFWGLLILCGIGMFLGKLKCASSPIGGALIGASLALDVLGLGLYLMDFTKFNWLLGFLSFTLLISFFAGIGSHLKNKSISAQAGKVFKYYGLFLGSMMLEHLTGFGLIAFAGACFGFMFMVSQFLLFNATLNGLARAR